MRPLLLMLVAAGTLRAAPADPWMRIRSANFELFTTGSERTGRDLIQYFEQVRGFFQKAFGFDGAAYIQCGLLRSTPIANICRTGQAKWRTRTSSRGSNTTTS